MNSMSKTIRINNRYEYQPDTDDCILGQGGMGVVYKGQDTQTGQPVAIKLLKSEFIARDPDMVERFEREGRALRALNHPNIVAVLDMVEENGVHYLVMEYVPGGSLYDLLQTEGQLSIQHILYIALDLADALTRAHRLNILHRDIKPANVLIAEDGTPRLTDFGMARVGDSHITQDGAIVGTLAYLGPEIYNGEDADERTDIWAFGIMLYEMLLGMRPYMQEQPGALINAIMTQNIPDIESLRPDVPTGLIDLIYRMLNKDRQARVPSIRMIGVSLETIIQGKNTTLQPVVQTDTGRFDTPTPTPVGSPTTPHIPNNLPAQPTAFVGRKRELNEIAQMIQRGERLITLIGTGGVGKSRIALAVAQQHLARFPDGVFYVSLAPLEDAQLLIATIAESLDFTFGGGDTLTELTNYLREKQMLLIMDNFEHIMESADILAELSANAPNVAMLVTSRERLRLRGEQIYEVDGMIVPKPDDEKPDAIMQYPAVELFIQSARRMQSDFAIEDDHTAHCVANIIREVYGLPLGIELAAAWLDSLPIDEIAQEIQRSLDFLETDLRDVPERHRSIRAVFEYSWNLMTSAERDTFLRLSVFRGGFERQAATAIADASLRVLTSLVNKSLLRRDPEGRYIPHKLLRQYAEERWDDQEAIQETRKKHASYYAEWLTRIYPTFHSTKERQAVEMVELEFDNINAALHWAMACDQWEAIGRTIHPMSLYFLTRSLLQDGRAQFARIVDAMQAQGITNTPTYWMASAHVALMNSRLGYYQEAFTASQEALAYFEAQGDNVNAAYALNTLSYASMMMGQFEHARDYASRATELTQDFSDVNAWFVGMGNLGYAEYLMGNYHQANIIYETVEYMGDQQGFSPSGRAYSYNNRGEIAREMGDFKLAGELFQQAYDIFKTYRHRRGMAFTLTNLAGIFMYQGNYATAKEMYTEANALTRKVGDLTGKAHAMSNLGNIASIEGNHEHAVECYEEALKIRRDTNDQRGIADSLLDLARTYITLGKIEKAEYYVDESIQIRRDIQDRVGLGEGLLSKAMVLLMTGIFDNARELIIEGAQIADEVGSAMMTVQADIGRGELALYDGELETAESYFLGLLEKYTASETLGLALYGLIGLARVRREQGNLEGALELVTLVLRYPRAFVVLIEELATRLLEELTGELPENVVTSTMERTQSMTLDSALHAIIKAMR
jgi:serine/threonine protein kinase/predicted ATPase/Tfp pilus assembly protein PilF